MPKSTVPPTEGPPLDVARIVETLDCHGVDYLLVGGASAQAYGPTRVTLDFDLVAADVEQDLSGEDRFMRCTWGRGSAEIGPYEPGSSAS